MGKLYYRPTHYSVRKEERVRSKVIETGVNKKKGGSDSANGLLTTPSETTGGEQIRGRMTGRKMTA